MCARVSLFRRRFTDTNVYGAGSVKNKENSSQYISKYTDIFLQCMVKLISMRSIYIIIFSLSSKQGNYTVRETYYY